MSESLFIGAILALGLFWLVGMYNRLMRLRAGCLSALADIEQRWVEFSEKIKARWDGDPAISDNLRKLLSTMATISGEGRQEPMSPMHIVHLTALLQTWSDALSTLTRQGEGDIQNDPLEQRAEDWGNFSNQLMAAKNFYNKSAEKYNAAVQQFPARVVAGLLGFRVVGSL